jgi:hypothetical protein
MLARVESAVERSVFGRHVFEFNHDVSYIFDSWIVKVAMSRVVKQDSGLKDTAKWSDTSDTSRTLARASTTLGAWASIYYRYKVSDSVSVSVPFHCFAAEKKYTSTS